MKITLIKPSELMPSLRATWEAILRAVPSLDSPYFRPEFTEAVAAVREDVEIALFDDAGEVVGFAPFQRGSWSVARPVGGRLSDYQGAIVRPDIEWDVVALLRACRLGAWEFDHLLAEQRQWQAFHAKTASSRFLDLSQGFESFQAARHQAGSKTIPQMLRKLRNLERDVGPVRFVWNDRSPAVWNQLRQWKSQQYCSNGLTDLFSFAWINELLERIAAADEIPFGGVMSALYAGDRLTAVHFGMRSGHVLHSWFPAYDRELSKCSPGLGLLIYVAQHAAEHGITKIDLGKGDEEYKLSMSSGATLLAEGAVDQRPLSAHLRRSWQATRDWMKSSPFAGPAKAPVRWMRRMRDWMAAP